MSDNSVASLSSVDETVYSAAVKTIAHRLAWLFDKEADSPGGPIGKLLGGSDDILAICEHDLPQRSRVKLILLSDVASEGRQKFLPPGKPWAFTLSWNPLKIGFSEPRFSEQSSLICLNDEEIDASTLWGLRAPIYLESSEDAKAHHLSGMLQHRLAVLRDEIQGDRAVQEKFFMHVLAVWLHIVNFNGKLGEKTLSGPPGTKYYETPYDPDPLTDPGSFPKAISNLLPGVLAHFRERAES